MEGDDHKPVVVPWITDWTTSYRLLNQTLSFKLYIIKREQGPYDNKWVGGTDIYYRQPISESAVWADRE
jgi:hypothetical protein